MKFEVENTFIADVKIISANVSTDNRGFFMEVFNKTDFDILGIPTNFVQMNHSCSGKNVIR